MKTPTSRRRVTRIGPLRAVVFQEGQWLIAQCLQYDIATQARNLSDLHYALERLVIGHVVASVENGMKPFKGLRPATKKYWEMFRRSRIPLPAVPAGFHVKRRDLIVKPPVLRVAA